MMFTKSGYSTFFTYLPLVAFFFVQISCLSPVIWICRNKNTSSLSPLSYISLFNNCIIWVLYGFLKNDVTILTANFIGAIAGIIYTIIFHYYTHISMTKYYVGTAVMLGFVSFILMWGFNQRISIQILGIMGCFASVVLMSSPLATIWVVINNKSTKSISFVVCVAMWLNGLSWTLYGYVIAQNDYYIIVPNAIGFIMATFQLSLFLIYRRTYTYEKFEDEETSEKTIQQFVMDNIIEEDNKL